MASASQLQNSANPALTAARSGTGAAADRVRTLLRFEGFAVLASALALYGHAGFSWPTFALLFLTPDLSMLAYLGGPRLGTIGYNVAHTYVVALAVTLAGFSGGVPVATAGGLVWLAHIGFDRALGYGLKYSTGFGDTHLGRIGRR